MLKHIPRSFTPELLKLLMEMGHGEELLISDGNYPARSTGGPGIPRMYITGHRIAELLADILRFFPLDESVEVPALVMESAKESGAYERYGAVFAAEGIQRPIGTVERFAFYERAERVAGILITADDTKGGNILLKKGVVRDEP